MADLMERLVEEAIGYAWSLPALLPGILGYVCRGPLHRLALAYAIRSRHALLAAALLFDATPPEYWDWLAKLIADEGRDPNWRKRPSVLDTILGLTAPRGRPRKKKQLMCPPSAAPYRRAMPQAALS